jgi:2',3'-cyclic-nucleotide 2'-phosphodiesterase (5'-nucleotidase family)
MNSRIIILLLISGLLFSCSTEQTEYIDFHEGVYHSVDSNSIDYQDSLILAKIAPYKAKLDLAMDSVITNTPAEYFRNKPNGTLNNLICDMVFSVVSKRYQESEFNPDFCLLNYGGLRRSIPKGEVTKSDIFQLMPFQNESVICRLSYPQMKSLFAYLVKTEGQPVSNIKIFYSDKVFSRAIINGESFDSTRSYNVLTSDYSARGGDKMNFFLQADTMILCGTLLRNDMFTYIESLHNQSLVASDEKRIIFE